MPSKLSLEHFLTFLKVAQSKLKKSTRHLVLYVLKVTRLKGFLPGIVHRTDTNLPTVPFSL